MPTALHISLPKDRLIAMPANDRALFLQVGNITNQLCLLARLLWFTTNRPASVTPIENRIMLSQSHILARYDAGLVWETWLFIKSNINGGIGKKFVPDLSPEAMVALNALGQQFKKKSFSTKYEIEWDFTTTSFPMT